MSEKGSVFQKGGGGTNFEQAIQTAFLTTLIIRGNAPLNFANEIVEVAFQTTNRGYETDDLLVVAKSAIGQHRMLVQIKNNITFTEDNSLFKEVIKAFWKDYNNTALFDKEKDRLIIIKSGFTKEERNHLKSLLDWANTHATEHDFVTEVDRIKGKKDRLDFFRESLKEVNNNIALTDKEIWEFLKCFDVLEYDFTNQNSVDEIYFLNLIKLCKNSQTTANEKEIWASILSFISKLNKDGGSVTTESIHKEEIYKHFDTQKLNPYLKSIEKLKSDSEVILLSFKNTIGGLHFDRKNISRSIAESVNNFQFTIVTGKPGVGKSAEVKDFLKNEFPSASIFVFRADQFNEPHIANVFSSQGVNKTLQDIFSCISLIPEKIIFIDSLEKLLEADPECAFKQLLALLKQFPDIKIIGSSRKYAVDLITQKFGIDKKELGRAEILPFDDDELNTVAEKFPQLQGVLKNEKIKKLLRSPKYLDFAIIALSKSDDDYSNVSLIEFKDKLWNSLVKNSINRTKGFPAKREDAFMEIAINRAKKMKLFTKSEKGDKEAVDLLENDEIIFQENDNRRYSPTHDILEDWALVKYVSAKYDDYPKPNDFFENLGNEPAIRRAFRLWVEDYLIEDSFKVNQLIKDSIFNTSIENYWADEILIAVFKSENSSSFFINFEKDLLANDCQFLNRCLHLIKTTCKENKLVNGESYLLVPIGSGWFATMQFVSSHIAYLDCIRLSIFNFIQVWEWRISFTTEIDENEKKVVKNIVCHFLGQIESKDKFWKENEYYNRDTYAVLIVVLYQLADVAQIEIHNLINNALNYRDNRGDWELNSFYNLVIERALLGIRNLKLIEELPHLIIQLAWKSWKLELKNDNDENDSIFGKSFRSNRLSTEKCWGIRDDNHFFPPGIYKTPIFNLLYEHPNLALTFILEFVNYSVDFYANADCEYKHEIYQINVELNDGTVIKQWANEELWVAFRSQSVTHYGLECILISLEKYLLALAKIKTEGSKNKINLHFDYLIKNSNNVAIMSVLASVAMAYPEELQEEILPIFSTKEFYDWDFTRVFKENSVLAIYDQRIPYAQQERIEFNKLPHRKKYARGLADFIVQYQFNIRTLNDKIHLIFDKMNSNILQGDIIWRKRLTEIDVRKWEMQEYDSSIGGFIIQPKYEHDVVEIIESGQELNASVNDSFTYSNKIDKALKREENILFNEWIEIYNYYCQNENLNLNPFYIKPVSLAIVGLRDFSIELVSEQKDWCKNCLTKTVKSICESSYNVFQMFVQGSRFNPMEKEIALTSFHYIQKELSTQEEKDELLKLLLYVIISPLDNADLEVVTKYIRTTFNEFYLEETKVIWSGTVKYAEYKALNHYFLDDPDKQKINVERNKELQFIEEMIVNKGVDLDIENINLVNYKKYILMKALLMTPVECNEEIYQEFITKCISLFANYIQSTEHRGRRRNSYDLFGDSDYKVKMYIGAVILSSDNKFSKQLLDLLLDPVFSKEYNVINSDRDHYEFVSKIMESVVYTLDNLIANSNDLVSNNKLIDNFWNIWGYFFEKIKNSERQWLASTLLLSIDWKEEASDWTPLHWKKEYYYKIVKELGSIQTSSILNVFSTVGEKQFLPDGLSWLVEIYKNDDSSTKSLTSKSAERLIERLFYNHITTIKNNKTLIQDFIWLLSKMVDLGSSNAYFFRENVITYKNNN